MKVSVIIPTFNRKKTLRRAIESVRNQSLSPYEILIIDDGSHNLRDILTALNFFFKYLKLTGLISKTT